MVTNLVLAAQCRADEGVRTAIAKAWTLRASKLQTGSVSWTYAPDAFGRFETYWIPSSGNVSADVGGVLHIAPDQLAYVSSTTDYPSLGNKRTSKTTEREYFRFNLLSHFAVADVDRRRPLEYSIALGKDSLQHAWREARYLDNRSSAGWSAYHQGGWASLGYTGVAWVTPDSWLCFAWARDLFGQAGGLLACALWCFSPMILGNASLIAPDAHSATLGLAACYTFWLWLKKPTWRQAALNGVVLGLAELSKTTLIVFFPLWPLLWLAYRWPDRKVMEWKQWRDEAGMLLLRMLVGLYILNLGYLGDGSFIQLKEYKFVSQALTGNTYNTVDGGEAGNRFANSWLGNLPVPLPIDYVQGIDMQQKDFEKFPWPSYLLGEYQAQGWWYFYIYAILVKAPLGTLGLVLLATLGASSNSSLEGEGGI